MCAINLLLLPFVCDTATSISAFAKRCMCSFLIVMVEMVIYGLVINIVHVHVDKDILSKLKPI